uniref:Uncharacterized protein n=1 Tax=Anguilla anguilla TaxID=7936 RepID=A0A0E9WY13_ANGAN
MHKTDRRPLESCTPPDQMVFNLNIKVESLSNRIMENDRLSSTPRYVFGFVFPLEAGVCRVEPPIPGPKNGPVWSLGHVVPGGEGPGASTLIKALDQLMESFIVNPCPPLPFHFKFMMGNEEAV